jgi:general secretion pathway protein G
MLKNNRGMTLLEIMMVMVILAGLMALVIPRVMGNVEKSKYNETKLKIQSLREKIEQFNMDCNQYPQELKDLVEQPSYCSSWGPEAYISKLPKDAWGMEFNYEMSDGEYTIISLGKDKREGGDGYGKDINSNDLE